MELFKDIYSFISMLNFVDVIFLIAVIVLLILIVTLIYFIRINKDEIKEEDLSDKKINKDIKKDNDIIKVNGNTYKIENNREVEEYNDEEAPLMDLESLTKKLENEKQNERVNFTEYERDQEEKAIISYDELLSKNNNYAINYEKEEVHDDLVIKKVNLNDLVNKNEHIEVKSEVRVISYDHEEAFLNALKELNKLLN